MIAENHYLIPEDVKKAYATQGKYLLVVTNLEEEEQNLQDPVVQKLNEFREDFMVHARLLRQINTEFVEKFELQEETMKKHEGFFKDLRTLLYANMPKISLNVSVHDKPLFKQMFEQLKSLNQAYKDGWFCDGKNLEGCRGGKEYSNNDPDE